jgi:hypothetical protein
MNLLQIQPPALFTYLNRKTEKAKGKKEKRKKGKRTEGKEFPALLSTLCSRYQLQQ